MTTLDLDNLTTAVGDAQTTTRRPFWLTGPCPPWCVVDHHDHDPEEDRAHGGLYRSVALTTMTGENYGEPTKPDWRPVELLLDLGQHYREAEPRVFLGSTVDGSATEALTLDEAERVALHLLALVAIGQEHTR